MNHSLLLRLSVHSKTVSYSPPLASLEAIDGPVISLSLEAMYESFSSSDGDRITDMPRWPIVRLGRQNDIDQVKGY